MTLQEILLSYGLDQEQIKAINTAVDSVLSSKTTDLKTQVDELNGKLEPYQKQEKDSMIAGMLPKNANSELIDDIVKLSDITDEDDEDSIKKKLEEAVNSRPHLQANEAKTDKAIIEKDKETTAPEEKPVEKKSTLLNV